MTQEYKKEIVQRIIRNLLDIQILMLIQNQSLWGYKIKKDVEIKYEIRLRHGALYPMLNELEKKGFLSSERQQQGGRTRKVYSITSKGKEYVQTYNNVLKEQIEL